MFEYKKSEQKEKSKDSAKEKQIQSQKIQPNLTGIPDRTKTYFENLSGFSFDDVRIHYNAGKPEQLQALAYTQKNHVYIAPGQEKHLNHELAHVVQQKKGIVQPTAVINGIAVNENKQLEQQADSMADSVVHADKKEYNPKENTIMGVSVAQLIRKRVEGNGGVMPSDIFYDKSDGKYYSRVELKNVNEEKEIDLHELSESLRIATKDRSRHTILLAKAKDNSYVKVDEGKKRGQEAFAKGEIYTDGSVCPPPIAIRLYAEGDMDHARMISEGLMEDPTAYQSLLELTERRTPFPMPQTGVVVKATEFDTRERVKRRYSTYSLEKGIKDFRALAMDSERMLEYGKSKIKESEDLCEKTAAEVFSMDKSIQEMQKVFIEVYHGIEELEEQFHEMKKIRDDLKTEFEKIKAQLQDKGKPEDEVKPQEQIQQQELEQMETSIGNVEEKTAEQEQKLCELKEKLKSVKEKYEILIQCAEQKKAVLSAIEQNHTDLISRPKLELRRSAFLEQMAEQHLAAFRRANEVIEERGLESFPYKAGRRAGRPGGRSGGRPLGRPGSEDRRVFDLGIQHEASLWKIGDTELIDEKLISAEAKSNLEFSFGENTGDLTGKSTGKSKRQYDLIQTTFFWLPEQTGEVVLEKLIQFMNNKYHKIKLNGIIRITLTDNSREIDRRTEKPKTIRDVSSYGAVAQALKDNSYIKGLYTMKYRVLRKTYAQALEQIGLNKERAFEHTQTDRGDSVKSYGDLIIEGVKKKEIPNPPQR